MATNPVTAARRLPQKGGRVETDLEAKHRVSHYDWCGQGPSRIDIKGIIFILVAEQLGCRLKLLLTSIWWDPILGF